MADTDESHGETLMRALEDAQQSARQRNGRIAGVVVLSLIEYPPGSDAAEDYGGEVVVRSNTPQMGPSRVAGILLHGLDLHRGLLAG